MINIPAVISIAVFYLLILAVGILAARKNNRKAASQTEEAMVAGRNIGVCVGVFTCTATWVGGGYINGTAESVYDPGQGLVWTQAPVAYAASLAIGGLLFARRMREARYVTMLDPLQRAFGDRMCAVIFVPCVLGEVFWTAAILSALGGTVSVVMDFDMNWSILVSAAIAVAYTFFGGLYSVAYTDVVQLIFIFFGLWTVVPFALTHPSVSPIVETAHSRQNGSSQQPGWLGHLDPSDRWRYADSALMLILGGVPWQVYFQRVLSQRTVAGSLVISLASSAAVLLMALPPALIGAAAASVDWDLLGNGTAVDSRFILPLVMQQLCPQPVAIVGLGAVSAAVMSSADSTVLSSASMFCRNVFKPLFCPGISEHGQLWVMRLAIVAVGAASAVLAISIRSVYGLWFLCSDLVYVAVFPQLTAAVFLPRRLANARGSLAGCLVGVAMRLTAGESLLGLPALARWPGFLADDGAGGFAQRFPVRTVSMAASFAVLVCVSLADSCVAQRRGGVRPEPNGAIATTATSSKTVTTTHL